MTYCYYSVTGNLIMEVDGRSITILRRGEDPALGQFVISKTHDLCPAEESAPESVVDTATMAKDGAVKGAGPSRRESADPFANVDLRIRCGECGEFLNDDTEQICGGCFKRLKEKEKKWDAIKANPELSPNFVTNLFASLEAMRKGDLGQDWDELAEELKREIGKEGKRRPPKNAVRPRVSTPETAIMQRDEAQRKLLAVQRVVDYLSNAVDFYEQGCRGRVETERGKARQGTLKVALFELRSALEGEK